jgi:hypothetical protein
VVVEAVGDVQLAGSVFGGQGDDAGPPLFRAHGSRRQRPKRTTVKPSDSPHGASVPDAHPVFWGNSGLIGTLSQVQGARTPRTGATMTLECGVVR